MVMSNRTFNILPVVKVANQMALIICFEDQKLKGTLLFTQEVSVPYMATSSAVEGSKLQE